MQYACFYIEYALSFPFPLFENRMQPCSSDLLGICCVGHADLKLMISLPELHENQDRRHASFIAPGSFLFDISYNIIELFVITI